MENIWIKKDGRKLLAGFYNQLDDVWVLLKDTIPLKKMDRIRRNCPVLILDEKDFINYTEKFVNQTF